MGVLVTRSGGAAAPVGGDFVASNQPLKVIYPMAIGSAGTGLNTNNRAFRQYPSIEYRIRLAAVGGKWPYVWTLSNQPSGMVVEEVVLGNGNSAFDLVWANPSTGTHSSIQVICTDSATTVDSETFTLTVGTSGHLFVDSNAGASGTGTFASPYQNLDDLYANTGATNSIAWFRGGGPVYSLLGIATDGTGEDRAVEFGDVDNRTCMFIAYPGDAQPVIDYGYTGGDTGARLRFIGSKIFMQGFRLTNGYVMGCQLDRRNQYGAYLCYNTFDELNVPSGGSNQSHIMTMGASGSSPTYGMVVCSNDMSLVGNEATANGIKTYYESDFLIEGNLFTNMDAPIELKENAVNFTVRNNTAIDGTGLKLIAGNLADNEGNNATSGDIFYNFLVTTATGSEEGALRLSDGRVGGDGPGRIHVGRNTIIGRIVEKGLSTTQGQHIFEKNVILNDEGAQSPIPYITDLVGSAAFDASLVTYEADNLNAAFGDGRVNASTGELSGAWAVYEGLRGHRVH